MTRGPERPLEVVVATPLGEGGKGGIDRMMDFVRRELADNPRRDVHVTFAATRGGGHILLSPVHLARFCAGLTWRRLRGRVDLVHINLASNGSTYRKLVVASVARALGIRFVVHLHGGGYRSFWGQARPALRRAIGGMFGASRKVIVLGRVWADFVAESIPGTAGRIACLPNAVPRPAASAGSRHDGQVHVLFLGRVGAAKGVPQLVSALAAIADLGWTATIAGDGEVDATRARVAELGLADRIRVTGWAGPAEAEALLAAADILCLPSLEENLPLSVIEGMAAGLAVVATPVGAVPDIIADGATGLLVPPGDAEALAAALRGLIADPALRQRLGAAAMAFHRERLDIRPYVEALVGTWKAASEGGSAA